MLRWAYKAIERNSESLAPFKIGGALGVWFIRLCSSFRPCVSSCLINLTIGIAMSEPTPDLSALHSSKWAPIARPIPEFLWWRLTAYAGVVRSHCVRICSSITLLSCAVMWSIMDLC